MQTRTSSIIPSRNERFPTVAKPQKPAEAYPPTTVTTASVVAAQSGDVQLSDRNYGTGSVIAEAHCDIPCGIYEPTPAKIAAKTVLRMVEQLEELALPDMTDKHALDHYVASVARRTLVKEQHAEICKHELQTLWSDFFKSEHVEQLPDLHDTVWKALKLCSKNKQEQSKEAAQELVSAVDAIAKMFYEAKKVPERYEAYLTLTDKLY